MTDTSATTSSSLQHFLGKLFGGSLSGSEVVGEEVFTMPYTTTSNGCRS